MKLVRTISWCWLLIASVSIYAQDPQGPAPVTASDSSTLWIVISVVFLTVAVVVLIWNLQVKKMLAFTQDSVNELKEELKQEKENLENQVKERTVGITKLNEQLNAQIADMKEEKENQNKLIAELKDLLEVKNSGDFLPICSNCKDIRDANGYWKSIEEFIQDLSDSDLSHTLCPECTQTLYPELFEGGAKPFCLSWNPTKAHRRTQG